MEAANLNISTDMDINKTKNHFMNYCSYIGWAFVGAFVFYAYKNGLFSSTETFREYVTGFGIWAPLIFLFTQAVEVIVPILPSAVGCVAGVVIFGPWMGLLYNYIGICMGSIIVFILAKRYGRQFVKGIVGEKSYEKYIGWADSGKNFDKAFACAIFFPIAPDDLLCYIAGLTKMTIRKFMAIILLGKPLSIALYSMGMASIGQHLVTFITSNFAGLF